nr:3'-5' exonuclease [Staphylococcus hominis]
MNNLINQNNYYFNMMTNEQAYLLDYLEEQTTAVIQGGAGTGKTMLAVEKARRLSVNGEKVLFLCFNSLLIQSLQQKYKNELSNVYFSNLNSIVSKALNKKANNDDIIQFLRNIEDYKIWDYKHIIIDEGQDFLDETVLLLKDYSILVDGVFYVFYDKNQLVQRRDNLKWLNDMECRLVLNKNCRNTKNIAKTSFKPLGIDDFKMKLEILGDKPIYHNSKTKEETLLWLENRIKMYLKNDVKKNQIVILTVKTLETSILKNTNKIGNLKISNNFDDKNILFTTARKYKGLEADVIIIIDLDYSTFNKEENKRLFYVASSRAKNHLELNSQLNEEELEKLFLVVSNGRTKKINALIGDLKVSIR